MPACPRAAHSAPVLCDVPVHPPPPPACPNPTPTRSSSSLRCRDPPERLSPGPSLCPSGHLVCQGHPACHPISPRHTPRTSPWCLVCEVAQQAWLQAWRGADLRQSPPTGLEGGLGAPAHVFHDGVRGRCLRIAVRRGPGTQQGAHAHLHLGVQEVVEHVVEEEVLVGEQ